MLREDCSRRNRYGLGQPWAACNLGSSPPSNRIGGGDWFHLSFVGKTNGVRGRRVPLQGPRSARTPARGCCPRSLAQPAPMAAPAPNAFGRRTAVWRCHYDPRGSLYLKPAKCFCGSKKTLKPAKSSVDPKKPKASGKFSARCFRG